MILFSVIIPACERNAQLRKCLDRLAPGVQTLAREKYEVLVTDDSSGATAEQMLREEYIWAKWIPGPRKGPAANRNNGARHAGGAWLAFVDDDCLPDPGLLAAYANAADMNRDIRVLEGKTYADRPRRSLAESAPLNEKGGHLWSCNFAIRKTLFDAMGGFDERFPYASMEDVDFCCRLKQKNEKVVFVPEAAVCHPWQLRNVLNEVKRHETSLDIYLSIHPEERPAFGAGKLLMHSFRTFVKTTLPGAVRCRGAGLPQALAWHACATGMAWRAFVRDTHPPTTMKRGVQKFLARHPRLHLRALRLLRRGSLEKRAFVALLKNGDIIIDAGANRGHFTELFSDIAGAGGKVHAFEPVPPTFEMLRARLTSAGCLQNCILNQSALGDKSGTATMNLPGDDDGQASLRTHMQGSWKNPAGVRRFECKITTLDLYAAEFARLDFIKCDVEGAELLVVQGARSTLHRLSPLLFLEVNPGWLDAFGSTPDTLLAELRGLGYDTFFLADEKLVRLAGSAVSGPANLLCAKSTRHAARLRVLDKV